LSLQVPGNGVQVSIVVQAAPAFTLFLQVLLVVQSVPCEQAAPTLPAVQVPAIAGQPALDVHDSAPLFEHAPGLAHCVVAPAAVHVAPTLPVVHVPLTLHVVELPTAAQAIPVVAQTPGRVHCAAVVQVVTSGLAFVQVPFTLH
jgi:hypothetical protein